MSGPAHGDRMMDLLWEGRVIQMFAVDGEEADPLVYRQAGGGIARLL
jgi:hypothetical protein